MVEMSTIQYIAHCFLLSELVAFLYKDHANAHATHPLPILQHFQVKDILAQSLIQMEDFLYKPSMPKIQACCNNGTNAILKDVACHKGWLSQLLVDYFRHYTNL